MEHYEGYYQGPTGKIAFNSLAIEITESEVLQSVKLSLADVSQELGDQPVCVYIQ